MNQFHNVNFNGFSAALSQHFLTVLPDDLQASAPTFPLIFLSLRDDVFRHRLAHHVGDASPFAGGDFGQFFVLLRLQKDLSAVFLSSCSHRDLQKGVYTYAYTCVNQPNSAINEIPAKMTPAPSRRYPPIFSPRNLQPKNAPITTLTSRMASE